MKALESQDDGESFEQKQAKPNSGARSYFDINQLELAFINRALSENFDNKNAMPTFVEIGRSERILRIQKRNLEALCRKNRREHRGSALEGELKKIISGVTALTARCFPPKYDS